MQPFVRAEPTISDTLLTAAQSDQELAEQLRIYLQAHLEGISSLWINDLYRVDVQPIKRPEGWPEILHLSIKRVDREIIRDWRELQEIKNLLVGRENEAVELFPAESRLNDEANQYHLWAFKDPTMRFPFGAHDRRVSGAIDAALVGAKQRPFGDDSPLQRAERRRLELGR